MEWCRMYTVRVAMCVVLLCCGLQSVVPDIMSVRDQAPNLQELMKSLNDYNRELEQRLYQNKASSRTTTPNPTPYLDAVRREHQDPRARSGIAKSREISLMNPSEIRSNDDSNPTPYLDAVRREHQDPRARSGIAKSREISQMDPSEIRTNDDFNRVFLSKQEGVNRIKKQFGPKGLKNARAFFPGVNKDIMNFKRTENHILRIWRSAKCRIPVPQVVRVKDYYPDPSRTYYPPCTVLHRCGNHTGCCYDEKLRCAPITIQEVTLYFYAESIGKNASEHKGIEKLLFQNHTQCDCQLINDVPRLSDGRDEVDGDASTPRSKCLECPVPFTSRIYKDGRCGCDCFDRQKPCLRIKRGREPLPEIERKCVEANHCHIPDCEYGPYDRRSGYCPRNCPRRQDEDQRKPHRRKNHRSTNHRWPFTDRD